MIELAWFRWVAVGLLPLAALACGDGEPSDGNGEGGQGGEAGAGGAGGGDGCVVVTVKDLRFDLQDDVVTGYLGAVDPSIGGDLPDQFFFQFYNSSDFMGPRTGTFDLSAPPDDNFGTCANCILITEDFDGQTSQRFFFQSEGTLTLDRDPIAELDLAATVTGLRLVEVTLDETLASTPVPGGACLSVPELRIDYKFVPPGWTCAAERYEDGAVCDCMCGAPDADCAPDGGLPIEGCEAEQVCVGGMCFDTCSAFDPREGCAEGVCSVGYPDDLCYEDPSAVASVGIGEACPPNTAFCAVDGSFANGLCDRYGRFDEVCRGLCLSDADCDAAQYERCYEVFFGLSTKGVCAPIFPPEWTCSGAGYGDGAGCACECGAVDPDCVDRSLPVTGCAAGEVCVQPALCAMPAPNDTCATALPLPLGTSSSTSLGGVDDYGTDPVDGDCLGFAVQGGPDVVYQVDLAAGQTLDVMAEAETFDVNVYLFGPGDASVCNATLAGCVAGEANVNVGEHLVFTAQAGGTYFLVIDSAYSFDTGGEFTLTAAVD
ncbi:PPC domain-containing protein [Chondromyces apiculatus]|uniref:Peptidase C-terminal archaeal/bacterial domain-containing protein n=1 Tax=Chondromyces apiculatus DSM 436 TaxID=1192034 RepID=A0A017TDH8_9BACT|nr:PPC domain-containing protein [Chondromyces apiculatus]EYF07299.1 Hypothetical protein CAP_0778 [Chondromyces apiculatus DSM 436]